MNGMGAERRETREEKREGHFTPVGQTQGRKKKRKLNWSIGSIIDGNQFQFE
jgi:hypothetical protein